MILSVGIIVLNYITKKTYDFLFVFLMILIFSSLIIWAWSNGKNVWYFNEEYPIEDPNQFKKGDLVEIEFNIRKK